MDNLINTIGEWLLIVVVGMLCISLLFVLGLFVYVIFDITIKTYRKSKRDFEDESNIQ